MKQFCLSLVAVLCLAQPLEIIPLSPAETAQLIALRAEVTKADAVVAAAWEAYCEVERKIKKARSARETSGACGRGGGGGEWSSGTVTSGYSRWSFSTDYKYLVHTSH